MADGEKVGKRRGRRTMLTGPEILARRETFVGVFEELWGEIAWELQRCKKESDLIRALSPLREIPFIQEVIAVFFQESKRRLPATIVRGVRIRLHRVQHDCADSQISKEHAIAQLKDADEVLRQSPRRKYRVIKRERKKRRKEASLRTREWRELSGLKTELETKLRGLEAGFARQEILKFLRSKRYELNPLSLANAFAGLPYMGWRQSMRRSMEQPSMSVNGLDYRIFKAISFIATSVERNSENIYVRGFREAIPKLPSRHRAARDELAKQWFFLERSIRRAFRNKPHPRAFSFEIAKHYFRQIRSRSQDERIFASQAELDLSRRK